MADLSKIKQHIFRDIEAGRFDEAIRQLDRVVKKTSVDPEFWFLHGAVSGQLGKYDVAISSLNKAVSLNPSHLETYANLGLAFLRSARYPQAIDAYRTLLGKSPSYPGAHFHLGYACLASGDCAGALTHLKHAIRLQPRNIEAHVYLVKALMSLGSPREALETARQGLMLDPDRRDLLILGASLHMELGQLAEAGALLDRVLAADPDSIEARVGKAFVHENRGDFQAALDIVLPIIQSGRKNADLAVAYARIARHFDLRDEAIAYIETLLAGDVELDAESEGTLNYQLGKMKDALGRYDEAFDHFRVSNTLRPHAFDPVLYSRDMAVLRQVYTSGFFRQAPRLDTPGMVPVFIVGMPRSGTTLAEQILASHPRVFGAGELPDIDDITRRLARTVSGGLEYPACMKLATADILQAQRDAYLEKLADLSSGARWVTDKMPHNFEHLGLIAVLFPNARIVHCIRNPLDTCLSIYFNDFNAGHGYATDLAMLGGHYNEYLRTMAHWRTVLPIEIFDLVYEDIIGDQERITRQLLEYCGLEWDSACLEFYRNRRTVSTFSYDQVRKPIYTGSVGRWRRYEKYLGPLIEALNA